MCVSVCACASVRVCVCVFMYTGIMLNNTCIHISCIHWMYSSRYMKIHTLNVSWWHRWITMFHCPRTSRHHFPAPSSGADTSGSNTRLSDRLQLSERAGNMVGNGPPQIPSRLSAQRLSRRPPSLSLRRRICQVVKPAWTWRRVRLNRRGAAGRSTEHRAVARYKRQTFGAKTELRAGQLHSRVSWPFRKIKQEASCPW